VQKFKRLKVIIVGNHGFVGSAIVNSLKNRRYNLNTPSKKQLDITNLKSITHFLKASKPQILINFASFTNIEEAEKQRNDKNASAWKTNVIGAGNLAKICKKHDIFLIQISTDSIFPGTAKFPGPYLEKTVPPDKLNSLGWYSYTKLERGKSVKKSGCSFALIRISYPFGNIHSEKDFVVKTIKYVKEGVSLFKDQYFTPTFIPNLAKALKKNISRKQSGIYHVACRELTTPLEFGTYLTKKLGLKKEHKSQHLKQTDKNKGWVFRTKHGRLLTKQTQKILNLKFHSWQKALDEFIHEYETQTN